MLRLNAPRGAAREQGMHAERWRLDGQVALVTGASLGIGLLMVARDDAQLAASADELQEEFPGRDVRHFAADVADGEQRREIFDWVEDLGGGLNILVNNAGSNTR